MTRIGRLRPADPAVGAWIAPRLGSFGGRIASVVPQGFAAYARVLHPAQGLEGQAVTWAAVCAATGRTPHALMQWASIRTPVTGRPEGAGVVVIDGKRIEAPRQGHLEPGSLAALLDVLSRHAAPGLDCFFALWEGWGWIGGELLDLPRLRHPGRDYVVFSGPLEAALELGRWPADDWFDPQSPQLVWPQDRSWCVAAEVDLDSTLVAGREALVDAVLAADGLEAWPVGPDDDLGATGDRINT